MNNGENTKLDTTEEEQDNIDYIAKRKAEQERLKNKIDEEIKRIGGSNATEVFFRRFFRDKGLHHFDTDNVVSMYNRHGVIPREIDLGYFQTTALSC